MKPIKKLAMLDLNGTVIKSRRDDGFVTTRDEWTWEDGAPEALQLLANNGWMMAVVTNQPAEHRFPNVTHQRMEYLMGYVRGAMEEVAQSSIPFFVCYHDVKHSCSCRKPHPGALRRAFNYFCPGGGLTTERDEWDVWMVGDKLSDIEAGESFGANVCGVNSTPLASLGGFQYRYRPTLLDAVKDILLCDRSPNEDLH